MYKYIFTFSLLYHVAFGFRILCVFPHIGASHFYVFKPLLRGLAEKGHQVTVISHFPNEEPFENYKDISLAGSMPIWLTSFPFSQFLDVGKLEKHINSAKILTDTAVKTCGVMMENFEVQNIERGQYDLLLIESFNSDCGLGLVHKLKLPFIGVTSHVLMSWTHNRMGMLTNPSIVPSHHSGFGGNPSLLEKVEIILVDGFFKWMYYYRSQIPERDILKQFIDEDIPELETIAKNISLILIGAYFPLSGVNLLPPNAVEIGGIHLHYKIKEPVRIDPDVEKFLDESVEGVVVFSMGSLLRAVTWPKEHLEAFKEAFSEIPGKVLWKWENDTMEGVPKNVKTVKWIQQFEVLRHKNIKAFITHGGMLGMTEAVYAGVPVVVIPMYGDQFNNAMGAVESGLGVTLDAKNVTKTSVLWALNEVLTPRIQKSAKKLSEIWRDRPLSPMDTAIYWIEHVAKHGGEHLKAPTVHLPFYKYLLLDVVAVLLSVVVIIMCCVYKIIKYLIRLCNKSVKKRKNE